jgi:hypothetical protein
MNTYHAFYNGKEIELKADSSYQAQQKAAITFKAKKSYQVTVVLVALEDNKEIVNIPDF